MVIIFSGVFLIILGLISLFFAIKLKPNFLVGYRSMRANSSQENYLTANKYAGKLLIIEGLFTAGLSFFTHSLSATNSALLGVGLFTLMIIIMFILTERYLKKNFKQNQKVATSDE